jgi:hypothetical protein
MLRSSVMGIAPSPSRKILVSEYLHVDKIRITYRLPGSVKSNPYGCLSPYTRSYESDSRSHPCNRTPLRILFAGCEAETAIQMCCQEQGETRTGHKDPQNAIRTCRTRTSRRYGLTPDKNPSSPTTKSITTSLENNIFMHVFLPL